MVPVAGIEPARPKATNFKSAASTNSATPATLHASYKTYLACQHHIFVVLKVVEASTGVEPV